MEPGHTGRRLITMRCLPPILILVVMAAGCGDHRFGDPPPPAAPEPTDDPRYTVTAPLLSVGGGPVRACRFMTLSLPPAGCGGVEVRGVDIREIPQALTYPNGTIQTPQVRLVGTWAGSVLTVMAPPRLASPEPTVPAGESTVPPGEPDEALLEIQERLNRDDAELRRRGIHVLMSGPAGDRVEILVAVADAGTVRYLTERYGAVRVTGGLQPVR